MFEKLEEKRRKYRAPVVCPAKVLFDVLEKDLKDGLCTDIFFNYQGRRHRFSSWGDGGNTYKNVVFALDDFQFDTKKELMEKACIDGVRLIDLPETVEVTDCDGFYPSGLEVFKPYTEYVLS